jgi:antirestriction protein ArdC
MHEQRFDIYEKVTSLIINQLEQGVIPWRKPWTVSGLPMNLLTRRAYTGVNYLLLNALPYEQQFYLTWKQIKSVGASVINGEKSHIVIFQKMITAEETADESKTVTKSFLRYYLVYNISQCKDLPASVLPTPTVKQENQPISMCEFVLEDMPDCPEIRHRDARAYYVPNLDYINMPKLELFTKSESYYCTLFHELIHSTGHSSRLNRKEIMEDAHFGSELYSVEELVAEIGACYLNAHCGIDNEVITNNTAYIANWLERLNNDKKFIVQAAARAQRAVDYVLCIDRSPEKEAGVQVESTE